MCIHLKLYLSEYPCSRAGVSKMTHVTVPKSMRSQLYGVLINKSACTYIIIVALKVTYVVRCISLIGMIC